MDEILTQSVQDYLKTIYDLTLTAERASTNQLAEALGVKPASITGMIQKMAQADPPLVDYKKHYGVVLTPHGEKLALEVIRHHRLLETFLYKTLGYEWDAVHAEACRLDHVISEKFEERIAQALGNPAYDPHGDPIPDRNLKMPPCAKTTLDMLLPGQQATIQRVRDTDPALLRYLAGLGLVPGVQVTLLDCSPFDANLSLQIARQGQVIVLGPRVARQLFIEITAN
jgi:DtxR family Mn-dependent transcriptional regulator